MTENNAKENKNAEKMAEDLTWLEHLQKNSWEPEVIISGIVLAFIFAFPHQLYNFSVALIQDYGINFIGGWIVLLYLSFIINIFKIFFISHLCLRFAWAGVLGLSYAFPHGVINENLFSFSKKLDYAKPLSLVLWLEKVCSTAFGIPLILSLSLLPITLYLAFLLFIYRFFDLDFFTIYLLFLISLIGFGVSTFIFKKNTFQKKLAKTLQGTLQAIYSSNVGKWKMTLYLSAIIISTTPFVIADTKDFYLYFQEINLGEEEIKWANKSWFFANHQIPNSRFARILLPKDVINTSQMNLYLAYYGEDENYLRQFKTDFRKTIDTLHWKKPQAIPDLYRFYLNDSLIELTSWTAHTLPQTNQKVYETMLDLRHLKTGHHQLRVEKLLLRTPFFDRTEPKLRKKWAVISFYKSHETNYTE